MDIVVCIKQVPHPDYFSKITIDPVTKRMRREGIPLVINPADRNAIELGLQLKEQFSGKVTVISMGPPVVRQALEEALAMGADEAILLCDPAFAGADSLATAFTLAIAIKKFCACSLVLCGNETTDSGTAQVGPQVAEFLDVPHVTNVRKISFIEDGVLMAERALENGYMKVKAKLPALLTVTREINEPRLPSVMGIMSVAEKPLNVYGMEQIGVELHEKVGISGSPTSMGEALVESRQKRRNEIFQGDPEQAVKKAVARMRELRVV